jgi:hypothetical protein
MAYLIPCRSCSGSGRVDGAPCPSCRASPGYARVETLPDDVRGVKVYQEPAPPLSPADVDRIADRVIEKLEQRGGTQRLREVDPARAAAVDSYVADRQARQAAGEAPPGPVRPPTSAQLAPYLEQ